MPRRAHIDAEGARQRIIGYGIERRKIFRDDSGSSRDWGRSAPPARMERSIRLKAKIAAHAGQAAAIMTHAALTFEVREIRPLADFGQGWEKSI